MSFESGSMSGRFFLVPKPLPADAVDRFADRAIPGLESLGDGVIQGWTTGRHALDRAITAESAFLGGHLRLALTQAERKVPEVLLKAECRMAELAHCEAQGVDKVSGSVRREIRRSVEERLIPQMPPTIRQIPLVLDAARMVLAAGALSDAQVDALQVNWAQTVGFSLVPLVPDLMAFKLCGVNVRDWSPGSFSPERDDEEVSHDPGLDFLMWLWFTAEAHGGMVKLPDGGSVAVMVEGPLRMVMEGAGAHDVAVSKGEPLLSAEVKAALMSGKKLRRARITLARGDEAWSATLDAVTFAWRGLRVPDGAVKLDPISRFQDRMEKLDWFYLALSELFSAFVRTRADRAAWTETVELMRGWVATRRVR